QAVAEADAERDAVECRQAQVGAGKIGQRLRAEESDAVKVGGRLMVVAHMRLPIKAAAALPAKGEVDRLRADPPIIRIVAQAEAENVLRPDVVFRQPIKTLFGPGPGPLFINGA